ncbi:uncharacterized protein LAESUDRAFT_545276 [Laetiporus sulphureus 93-53]|uniref:Uncharacterized protein n=1 Tax=Laetiporus sulphureus 93-53 TaxID=1314785 RepID=A0A165FNR9_9APHY|nr:uncharacterized protein LAESUDRAFT_545276 [Laetiporus sulphureus 93-53]KZT09247.1 hypothetical protein LAESUDRAFT_545276 [Laetiporus sulphureus 93-53]
MDTVVVPAQSPSVLFAPTLSDPLYQQACVEALCAVLIRLASSGHELAEEILRSHLGINSQVQRPLLVPGCAPDGLVSSARHPDEPPLQHPYCATLSCSDVSRYSVDLVATPTGRQSNCSTELVMSRKRRSLTSIFSPTFLQIPLSPGASSSSSNSARSSSAVAPADYGRDSISSFESGSISSLPDLPLLDMPMSSRDSPPPDLLDEDPFANLSPAPSIRRSRPPSLVIPAVNAPLLGDDVLASDTLSLPPRSPLSMSASPTRESFASSTYSSSSSFVSLPSLPSTPPPTPDSSFMSRLTRPKSSVGGQLRPAYTRPAFAPRPSLPSLNTLARTHIVLPKVCLTQRGSVSHVGSAKLIWILHRFAGEELGLSYR